MMRLETFHPAGNFYGKTSGSVQIV